MSRHLKARAYRTLGESLRARRLAAGFTSHDVALACCITPTAMSRLEHGRAVPRFNTLCLLAIFYDVSLSQLLADVSAQDCMTR